MKKFLMIISLMFVTSNMFAQKWTESIQKKDELLGVEESVINVYTDGNFSFKYTSSCKYKFKIMAKDKVFTIPIPTGEKYYDENGEKKDFTDNNTRQVMVGFYDENGNLIKKMKIEFYIRKSDGLDTAFGYEEIEKYSEAQGGGTKHYISSEPIYKTTIIDYIEKQKGYVRMVCDLYGTTEKFDLKIACKGK